MAATDKAVVVSKDFDEMLVRAVGLLSASTGRYFKRKEVLDGFKRELTGRKGEYTKAIETAAKDMKAAAEGKKDGQ